MPESISPQAAEVSAAHAAPRGHVEEITDRQVTSKLQRHLAGFLLGSTGFFASLLRNMNKVCTRDVPTMGVAFSREQDRFNLYWNPDFVDDVVSKGNALLDGMGDTRMRNILVHEMLHVALKHCTVRKRDPHELWNIATDLAINSMIVGLDRAPDGHSAFPPGALIPGKEWVKPDGSRYVRGVDPPLACDLAQAVGELPPNLLSEVYFEALRAALQEHIIEIESMSKPGSGQPGDDGQGDGTKRKKRGMTLDDHALWDERGGEKGGEASADDREYTEQRVRDLLRRAVQAAEQHSDGWGHVPQAVRAAIKGWLGGEVDWRKILAMWANGRIRAEISHTIRRINRRYPYVHPGVKRNHRPLLLIAKDQSGSVSDEAVALFYGELDALSQNVDFDQVAFDTQCGEVTRWARGSRPEPTRERCGGTDFDAVTRLMQQPENAGRWDGVVMLTDGECSKPAPSLVSRIWVICPKHKLMFQPDDCELVIELSGARQNEENGVLG